MTRTDSASSVRGIQPAVALRMLTVAIALACTDSAPSVTYDPGVAAPPPLVVVDTGAVPSGLLAVTFYQGTGPSRVYTVRPDGTGLTGLTPDAQFAQAPAWSPDGTRIAYESNGDEDVAGIWVIRADGSGAIRIAQRAASPFWLDDARVGYGCGASICVVGADGSDPSVLIARQQPPGTTDDSFTLSPDGTSFAFVRHIPNVASELSRVYVMGRDGSNERALTPNSPFPTEAFPSWSGDSKRIAFYSASYGIAVADAEGRSIHSVSHRFELVADFGLGAPAWSPDGTRIVFGEDPRRFYIANADGSGAVRRVSATVPGNLYTGTNAYWSWTSR